MNKSPEQTQIRWVSVKDRMPKIDDKNTSVLFWHDGDVHTGWPLDESDGGDGVYWESASDATHGKFAGVEYWAYFHDPGEHKENPDKYRDELLMLLQNRLEVTGYVILNNTAFDPKHILNNQHVIMSVLDYILATS